MKVIYEVYFNLLGERNCISTEYEPEQFGNGFWVHEDDEGEYHLSHKEEEAEWMIPVHQILTIRKIFIGD